MAYLTSISTSALNNQNIDAALLVHTFTNTTRVRKAFVNVFVKDIVGGGDYTAHLTWDRAGVGQFYESLKTTKTVAAGVTTTCFESIPLVLDAAAVLKVYLLGRAGDNVNAVDIITDVYEEFVATDASGLIYLSPVQGPVEFGQVKMLCNVANEGALHCVNTNALGRGMHTEGVQSGQYNTGTGAGGNGQVNIGVDTGQYNNGVVEGQYNYGGSAGMRNSGGFAGQRNEAAMLGTALECVGGVSGALFQGTSDYGAQFIGGTAPTDPDWMAALTTIIDRIGAFTGAGLNTVLGFFQALGRKSGAITPADMGGTYDNQTDSLEAIEDDVAGIGGDPWATFLPGAYVAGQAGFILDDILGCTCGGGAIAFTYTVTDAGTGLPIDGVCVWITTDVAGTNVIWIGHTDAFGVARDNAGNLPMLDAGTYQFWRQLAGFVFANPQAMVVS
jgi:hypothetical protein